MLDLKAGNVLVFVKIVNQIVAPEGNTHVDFDSRTLHPERLWGTVGVTCQSVRSVHPVYDGEEDHDD